MRPDIAAAEDDLGLRRALRATIARGAARVHDARDARRDLRLAAARLNVPCLCGQAVDDHTDPEIDHCALTLQWAQKDKPVTDDLPDMEPVPDAPGYYRPRQRPGQYAHHRAGPSGGGLTSVGAHLERIDTPTITRRAAAMRDADPARQLVTDIMQAVACCLPSAPAGCIAALRHMVVNAVQVAVLDIDQRRAEEAGP